MIVNGKKYTSDLVILPGSITPNWRREKGHLLQMNDLHSVLESEIDTLVIGTGKYGLVKVPEELIKELSSKNIKVFVEKSSDAVERFNELAVKRAKVGGAFHLNC